ncbi:MAG: NEW3 domain-containing protein [Thermofilaceae archaeon]
MKAAEIWKSLIISLLVTTLLPQVFCEIKASGGIAGVTGIIVDPEGNPIPGVKVVAYGSGNLVATQAYSTAQGGFYLQLPTDTSNTYTLKFSKPGYVEKTITITVSKDTLSASIGEVMLDYSIAISMPIISVQIPVLGSVTLPVSIANRGSAPEEVSLTVMDPCGLNASFYSGSFQVSTLRLNPSDSQSLTLEIKAPFTAPPSCTLRVLFNGTIPREKTVDVTVKKTSLNLISAQLTSIQCTPGSVIQLPLSITNALKESIKAKVLIDLPDDWKASVSSSTGGLIGEVYLQPNNALQATLQINVPRETLPKTYTVTVVLDGIQPMLRDSFTLSIVVTSGSPLIRLTPLTPHVDTYAGKSGSFRFELVNLGDADCLVGFNVTGLPEGYRWTITDLQGNAVSQVYLKAGGSSELSLSVSVPPLAEPSVATFVLKAFTKESNDEAALSLGVLGRYELSFVTQSFYLEMNPGSSEVFNVQVKNTGYSLLTNVALSLVSTPSGFSVDVNPTRILLLKPGETATFTVSLAADATVDTGDYYLSFMVKTDQTDALSRDLHVYVKPTSSIVYIALAVITILMAVVIIVYRRFGRR